MRKHVPVVLAVLVMAALTVVFVGAPLAAAEDQSANPSAAAAVVRVDRVVPPRHKVVHRRFKPWAHPTPGQVREIIRAEARRWRIDSGRLARRVACESRFRWWAGNGAYRGVLQFSAGAFYRGLNTIRDRRVVLVRKRLRTVYEERIVHYADGHVERRHGARRHQRVTYILRGALPRRPAVLDAWAQLRIGAQAIRGLSAVRSSEWSCTA